MHVHVGLCSGVRERGLVMLVAGLAVAIAAGHLSAATYGPLNVSVNRMINTSYPDSNNEYLRVGNFISETDRARSLFQFDMTTAPAQSLITNCKFRAFHIGPPRGGTGTYSCVNSACYEATVRCYALNQSWNGNVTWNTRDGSAGWSSGGGALGGQLGPAYDWHGACEQWFEWNFTTRPTNGVLLKADQEGTGCGGAPTRRKGVGYPLHFPDVQATLQIDYNPPTGHPNVIRDWAVIGFYNEADGPTRLTKDFFDPTNTDPRVSESQMAARLGATYNGKTWQALSSGADTVDALVPFPGATDGTSYGFTYVKYDGAGDKTNCYLGIGSDDGVRVWLNGSLVHSNDVDRGTAADTDFVGPVTLKQGWNRLMVKADQGVGGHGWYCRLANADRTYVGNCSYFSTDSTPPTAPTSVTEQGGAEDGVPQDAVSAPSFTWSGSTDSQGSGEGVSGLIGYYVYFGDDPNGTSTTFQTGTSLAPGEQAEGTYYLRLKPTDAALNGVWETAFTFIYLVDECPDDPNKTKPGICGCGVPDDDTDADGTADCIDGCPEDPDKIEPGVCGCGVPDDDTDEDGTPDCIDGCPEDPDKIEPGQCGCGEPDTDTDGDGTADCIDGCPEDPDKIEPGVCGCGVSDVDTDGDSVPDCNDGCPEDPDKIEPGVCGCGVSDVDTDGDSVPDCNDGCLEDPDKIEPGQCGCGVPDTDTDGDGTADCNDGCPDDPDKFEPGQCGCGVPDTDTDGDSIADCVDNCPEVLNQDQTDTDGNGVGDACELPSILEAVSRKVHGPAGPFDLDVLSGTAVEPRQSSPTLLVVTLNELIDDSGLDNDDVGVSSGTVDGLAAAGNVLEVSLSGVTHASTLIVDFTGIVDLDGNGVTDTVCLGALVGDVNGDRSVNIFDLVQVRNALNQAVTAANFRSDTNADGSINIFDLVTVRNSLNTSASGSCP